MTSCSGQPHSLKQQHILQIKEKDSYIHLAVCVCVCVCVCVSSRTPGAIKVSSQLVLLGSNTGAVRSDFLSLRKALSKTNGERSSGDRQTEGKGGCPVGHKVGFESEMNWEDIYT